MTFVQKPPPTQRIDQVADQNIDGIFPLTALQEGILFHHLENPTSGAYFDQYSCELRGDLDSASLHSAWEAAVARHAILRTLFTWERRDRPLQVVRKRVVLPFEELDWSGLSQADEDAHLQRWLRLDRDRGFDLGQAPLMRITLLRLGGNRQRLIWSFHHLLLDGWSMRMVRDEVFRDYTLLVAGEALPASTAPAFSNFVSWLTARDIDPEATFWHSALEGFRVPVFTEVGPAERDEHAAGAPNPMRERRLSAALSRRLEETARERRLTLNTLVLGAWGLLLSRYSGSDDIVFGTTVAGRPTDLPGAEQIAGLFINTLPLRVAIDDGQALGDYLADVQRRQLALREFEQTPLTNATRFSDVPRGKPLFESIVVFENFPAQATTRSVLEPRDEQFVEYSHYPLALLAVPGEQLQLLAVHNPARIGAAATARLLAQLETVLTALCTSLDTPLGEVPILPDTQRAELLDKFNATTRAFDAPMPVQSLFEAHARRNPDALAVAEVDAELSYRDLDRRANALALRLQQEGVAAGQGVVLLARRGIDAIVGILAVLKAGGAYVALDPDYPGARLAFVLEDLAHAGVPLVLAADGLADRLPDLPARVVSLENGHAVADEPPEVPWTPDQLAYVIYTSGSTGRPKGVLVSHANLLNSTRARSDWYGAAPASWLLLSSLATDSSVAGVFWPLCTGGTLVLPAARAEQDLAALSALIAARRVSHTLCVPSLYALLLENTPPAALATLHCVIVAGEACPAELVARHHALLPATELVNEYGPSEATVWASAARLGPEASVTIGAPIANTQLYVLDARRRPLPVGVAGELWIGGANVARGYLHAPERTAEVFIDDPWSEEPGARLYRTGDRARWTTDGQLEFVGRTDHQLKIRGFRVEPGEVETALAAEPGVAEAVVLMVAGKLTACVTSVAGATLHSKALQARLQDRLPAHMVPQRIIETAELPRSPGGKIDREALAKHLAAALPEPAATPAESQPRDEIQALLATLWKSVLGLEAVGIYDDFFALGGDSLLSIRILSRAGKAGLRIAPEDFFANPTIAGQAAVASMAPAVRAEAGIVTGEHPLLPIQAWFFRHITQDPAHWNQSLLLTLHEHWSRETVERTVQLLLLQHDALRSTFALHDGERRACIGSPAGAPPVHWQDLAGLDDVQRETEMAATARRLNTQLDLADGPLLRVACFDSGPDKATHLLVIAHHLVVDAESWQILLDDLQTLGSALHSGAAHRLPAKTSSLRAWAQRLPGYAQEIDAADCRYWQERAALQAAPLPVDGTRDPATATEADVDALVMLLDAETSKALVHEVPVQQRCRTLDALVSALARVLGDWSGTPQVRFDMEGHGREPLFKDLDVSRTVGWFTSSFPVTLDLAGCAEAVGALREVKETLRALPQNGLGFGLLRDYGPREVRDDLQRAAPAQVLFNYLGRDAAADAPGAGVLTVAARHFGDPRSPRANRAWPVEINARLLEDGIKFEWRYSEGVFDRGTIEQRAQQLLGFLQELAGTEGSAAAPSDFPLAGLDQGQLDDLSDLLDDLD